MGLRSFSLGMMAISGWAVITVIIIHTFLKGGQYAVSINLYGEMYIEIIIIPLILIIAIILTIMEWRSDGNI